MKGIDFLDILARKYSLAFLSQTSKDSDEYVREMDGYESTLTALWENYYSEQVHTFITDLADKFIGEYLQEGLKTTFSNADLLRLKFRYLEELKTLVESDTFSAKTAEKTKGKKGKIQPAKILIELVQEKGDLFHTPIKEVFIRAMCS